MTIIFAQPRHEYGSYQDLRQLIALSDFPLVYYDEIDVESDNTYILTVRNGDIENGFPESRARLILYDLEYRREVQAPIPGIPEVWHMDKMQAELIGAKYVPIGGHAGLRLTETAHTPIYDVAFLAYMTHRRQHIHNELINRGLRLTPTSAWTDERDWLLNDSKVYLHVHQHEDIPAVPGLRMVVAAAYKLPVISELCADAGWFTSEFMYQRLYDRIAPFAELAAHKRDVQIDYKFEHMGAMLHQFLCVVYTFRKGVEGAL